MEIYGVQVKIVKTNGNSTNMKGIYVVKAMEII